MPTFSQLFTILSFLGLSFEGNQCVSSSIQALTCSRHSDSGERCKVKKEMKSRGETLPPPPPSFLFFHAPFYFPPLPTTWMPGTGYPGTPLPLLCERVCEVSIDIHWRIKICWGVESFELLLNPFPETQRCCPLNKAKFPLNIIS